MRSQLRPASASRSVRGIFAESSRTFSLIYIFQINHLCDLAAGLSLGLPGPLLICCGDPALAIALAGRLKPPTLNELPALENSCRLARLNKARVAQLNRTASAPFPIQNRRLPERVSSHGYDRSDSQAKSSEAQRRAAATTELANGQAARKRKQRCARSLPGRAMTQHAKGFSILQAASLMPISNFSRAMRETLRDPRPHIRGRPRL